MRQVGAGRPCPAGAVRAGCWGARAARRGYPACVAQPGRQVFVYTVPTDSVHREILSLLELDWVGEHGLPLEGVLGLVPQGVGAEHLASGDLQENPVLLRFLCPVRVVESRAAFHELEEATGEVDDDRSHARLLGVFGRALGDVRLAPRLPDGPSSKHRRDHGGQECAVTLPPSSEPPRPSEGLPLLVGVAKWIGSIPSITMSRKGRRPSVRVEAVVVVASLDF
jgi:hypothetical protein